MSVNSVKQGLKKIQAHHFITTGTKKRNNTSIDLNIKTFRLYCGFIRVRERERERQRERERNGQLDILYTSFSFFFFFFF